MGLDLFIEKKTRASKKLAYFRKVNFLISFIEDYYRIGVGNGKDVEIDKLQEWIDLFAKLPGEKVDRPVDDLIESIFLFMEQGGLSTTMSNEVRENLKTVIRSKIWEVDSETLEKLSKKNR